MANEEIKILSVIRVATEIGKGTHEDPFQLGFEYWDMDGKLLFTVDAEKVENITYEQA